MQCFFFYASKSPALCALCFCLSFLPNTCLTAFPSLSLDSSNSLLNKNMYLSLASSDRDWSISGRNVLHSHNTHTYINTDPFQNLIIVIALSQLYKNKASKNISYFIRAHREIYVIKQLKKTHTHTQS